MVTSVRVLATGESHLIITYSIVWRHRLSHATREYIDFPGAGQNPKRQNSNGKTPCAPLRLANHHVDDVVWFLFG